MSNIGTFKEDKNLSVHTIRIREAKRMILWYFFSKKIPLYLVTEFPKSGGTWFSKMLSELTNTPFPPPIASPKFKKSILRGTKLYNKNFHNIIVVMRDGRDIMVSAYFHMLFNHEANQTYAVEEIRNRLQFEDYDNVEKNMPEFIKYMFTQYPKIGYSTRFSWADFVDSWINKNCHIVKYEDLLIDPTKTMMLATKHITGKEINIDQVAEVTNKYSFKKLTGRNRGEEVRTSFARKGISGDWKNYFNTDSKLIFHKYAGPQLIDLGYETDDSWLN